MSEPSRIAGAAAPAAPGATTTVEVERWESGVLTRVGDDVAEERPIAFKYLGVPHVVMLATPTDLEDMAVGFTLTEALVADPSEIRDVRVTRADEALEVDLAISAERFAALLKRHRNLTGRTGCGMCGAETLADAIREPPKLAGELRISARALHVVLEELTASQLHNARTGSLHAAAWVVPDQGIVLVREDVGRHNALDKLIGALVRAGKDLTEGYVVMTSRASYEIVQKAATVGIAAIVAVSAPTAFAIRAAAEFGVTLIGFARRDRHVVYAHGERMLP